MKKPTQKALLEAVRDDPDLLHRLHRLLRPRDRREPVSCPDEAFQAVRPYLFGRENEVLLGVALSPRRRVWDIEVLTQGSDRCTVVDPRQILRWALTLPRGAPSGIVLAHNHPSGNPAPSGEDLEVTRRMARACQAVSIELVDHLVVGGGEEYTSLREQHAHLFPAPNAPGWVS